MDADVVTLSRLQFALTALYHFLFVPLTLGLCWMLAIMESVYVMTGREIWRRMTQFWGVLFGINFAMGVATGVTMEFQFGTNWAYYAHYVGDIFGAPLAIEGLMAFFLEASFVGLFFFGWERLSRVQHLAVTWLLALGTNLSALWILIANAWMQNPVGAEFNLDTMRMELTSFGAVIFNPVAQSKFVHTVSAGYVMGAVFVLAISAWYLLRGRNREFAKRSMTIAASFGLASALSVVVLGDESGYTVTEHQKMKLAAIEAMWETEPAPAAFTAFGLPSLAERRTLYAVRIPWLMGLIGTRSVDTVMPGIAELVARARERIASGLVAYDALERLRQDRNDAAAARARRSARRYCSADRTRRRQHGAERAAAVLGLPPDGRLRLLFHRPVRARVLVRLAARAGATPLVPARRPVQPAAAVDRQRAGLDRGGGRQAALGHRGRAAHGPGGVERVGRASGHQPRRLRAVLQRAGRGRCAADGEVRATRAGRPGSVARSAHAGRPCLSTTPCAWSGGYCSACCSPALP